MNRCCLILLWMLMLPMGMWGRQIDGLIDGLLDSLDISLSHKEEYERLRWERIEGLEDLYGSTGAVEVRYEIVNRLFDEYKSFRFDSSLVYGYKSLDLALQMGDADAIAWARCNLVFAYSSAGESLAAQSFINEVDASRVSERVLRYYYYVCRRYWLEESNKSIDTDLRALYMQRSNAYIDSLLVHTAKGSPAYWACTGWLYGCNGKFTEALECYAKVLSFESVGVHERAMLYADMAWAYNWLGKDDESLECFVRSAIADNESATREITALYWVANKIGQYGDMKRFFRYMYLALDDVTFYNSSRRKLEISNILTEIERARFAQERSQKKFTIVAAAAVLLLALALALVIYIMYRRSERQRALLASQRALLEESSTIISDLESAVSLRTTLLGRLLYADAEDVNRLKKMCKSIERQLYTHNYELLKETIASKHVDEAFATLYATFDSVILALFPNFVEKYNELFAEGDRQQPDKEGSLTMEMRIFALIRLGITSSEKISNFLGYSIHTVNTYKTRIKNKSLVANELFEQRIGEI